MTFSYLHLKLLWSSGIYPNPRVKRRRWKAGIQTHSCANLGKKKKTMRMNKRKCGKSEGRRSRRKTEKRRSRGGQDRYDLSVRCPEFWCTWCHPHDRAVCRGHLPHYGKCMHLGQALAGSPTAWAGKMAHLQLLLHYVSKLCTLWIATVPSTCQATSWLPGLECLASGVRKVPRFNRRLLDDTELQTAKSTVTV